MLVAVVQVTATLLVIPLQLLLYGGCCGAAAAAKCNAMAQPAWEIKPERGMYVTGTSMHVRRQQYR